MKSCHGECHFVAKSNTFRSTQVAHKRFTHTKTKTPLLSNKWLHRNSKKRNKTLIFPDLPQMMPSTLQHLHFKLYINNQIQKIVIFLFLFSNLTKQETHETVSCAPWHTTVQALGRSTSCHVCTSEDESTFVSVIIKREREKVFQQHYQGSFSSTVLVVVVAELPPVLLRDDKSGLVEVSEYVLELKLVDRTRVTTKDDVGIRRSKGT